MSSCGWDAWPRDWGQPSALLSSPSNPSVHASGGAPSKKQFKADPSNKQVKAHPTAEQFNAHPTEEQFKEMMSYRSEEGMPKRLKIFIKGFRRQENKRMLQEDRLSDMRGSLERQDEDQIIIRPVEEKIVVEQRIVYIEPKFAAGQSVHQWWAGWMAGATELPKGIKGKSRPAWFSSSVFALQQLCPKHAGMPECQGLRPAIRIGSSSRSVAPGVALGSTPSTPARRPAC